MDDWLKKLENVLLGQGITPEKIDLILDQMAEDNPSEDSADSGASDALKASPNADALTSYFKQAFKFEGNLDDASKGSPEGSAEDDSDNISQHNSGYFSEAFIKDRRLGQGGFGFVYKCRHKYDNLLYAVKKVPMLDESYELSLREVRNMAILHHKFVVRYFQAWVEDGFEASSASSDASGPEYTGATKSLYIAMEFYPRALNDVVERKSLDTATSMKYFRQLLEALSYIHGKGIVHGDLKPSNIFIDEADNIKIGDFGLSVEAGKEGFILTSADVRGNYYRSPEMEERPVVLSGKSDVYSLGLLVYEMLHPSMNTTFEKIETFKKIRDGSFDWTEADPVFLKFVPKLFKRDPQERASAEDLLVCFDELSCSRGTMMRLLRLSGSSPVEEMPKHTRNLVRDIKYKVPFQYRERWTQ